MAEMMARDTAMRIARDMTQKLPPGVEPGNWSAEDCLSALEALSFEVIKLERGMGMDELRRERDILAADNRRLMHIESEDQKKAARAAWAYFEIETIAQAGRSEANVPALKVLDRIAAFAREQRQAAGPTLTVTSPVKSAKGGSRARV